MILSARTLLAAVVATALGACASAPADKPQIVDVDAGEISREYSSFNARVHGEAAAVEQTFTTSLEPGAERVTRLESTYTQSLGSNESLRLGDTVSSSGMWGRSVRYAGMQFGSSLETRADVFRATELATTGLAVLPTVADALFASADDRDAALAHQNLSIDRSIPMSGAQAWDLVASDAFGRSESIDAPMIAGTRLVAAGCEDFSVGVGRVRRDYAITSNEYGPLFANTTVACAAPLGFTVEGHGEHLADQVTAFGLGLARQVGPLGTASMAFASSRADAGSGWLARFGFEHSNSLFNVMLRSRMQSRDFRDSGSVLLEDPVMQRDLASLGVNVAENSTLSLAYAAQMTWSRERTNLIALRQSLGVGRGSLSMSAGHSLADNFGASLFISYKRPLGAVRAPRSAVEEFDLALLESLAL